MKLRAPRARRRWLTQAARVTLVLLAAGCTVPVPLPPKALEMNRLGAAALGAGDLQTAEARLAIALEYSPKFTEAWVNLGLLELRRGNLNAARKDLTHARSLNPDLPSPHHAIGLLEERMARPKQAAASYRAALEVNPGFAPSRANLGRLLFGSARYDDAREQFLRLTEVAPESLEGWLGLAESLLRLGRERDSDLTVGRARRRFGDRPELVLLIARQLLRRRAFADAEALLAPLTAEGDLPRSAAAWSWVAVARLGAGHVDGAVGAAKESLAADPSNPVARYVLAQVARPADGVAPGSVVTLAPASAE
jgi:tetratricopeptide (TPR) repeat protein